MSRRKTLIVYALLPALLALAAAALLTVTRDRAGVAPDVSAYEVRGIDISRHNGDDIDFEAVAGAGYSFVYIKASEGTDFKDSRFVDNVRRAQEAGLAVGAYHFFRFDTDGEMQAVNLLHSLRHRAGLLPAAIDIEEWGNPDGEVTSQIIGRLRAMLALLGREGVDVVLYTNKDGYERFVRGNFDDYPLWISSFTTPASDMSWTIWQYTHSGSVAGVKGNVDINVYRGNRDEFTRFACFGQD